MKIYLNIFDFIPFGLKYQQVNLEFFFNLNESHNLTHLKLSFTSCLRYISKSHRAHQQAELCIDHLGLKLGL